jgi:putative ABC transport system permease protein
MFNGVRHDLRHALRSTARTPALTGAILITMALGIGATAAVSTVVWKVLLQPLPLRDSERVLALYRVMESTGQQIPSVSYPDLVDWQQRSKSFVGIAPYMSSEATLIKDVGPVSIRSVDVGAEFFNVLGSKFVLGRTFDREAFFDGADSVAILSPRLWRTEFGGDPAIVGKTIELASGRARVVGVIAPDEFTLPVNGGDIWTPLHVPTKGPNAWMSSRETQWLQAIARVRSDVDPRAAMDELRAVDRAVQLEFPRPTNGKTVMGVAPLHEYMAGPVRTMLLFLAGAMIIVLLVVCTNIANLRLVQAQARQREYAMRLVLGARFGRLARQSLTESMLLACGGAAAGLILARPLLRGLLALYPGRLPRLEEIRLSSGVTGWSLVIAVVAGFVFAVPQLLQLVRMDAGRLVKERERGVSTRGQRLARRGMVVVQLALSGVMLVSSGLLVRSFLQVTRVSPGFDASGVLSFGLSAAGARYASLEATEQLYSDIADRVRGLPGVRMVGSSNAMPLTYNPWTNGIPRPNAAPGEPALPVNVRLVSPEYLELLRVPLRRGRQLAPSDNESAPAVVVINEGLAKVLYPGEDPVGKRLDLTDPTSPTIVGVVGNVHHTSLIKPVDNEMYVPFRQNGTRRSRVLAIRVDGDPARIVDAVQREIHAIDSRIPIRSLRTLDDIVSASVAPQRFRAAFIGSLAVLALALAVVGVYGVVSYTVSERTQELGIRVALGERPSQIRWRVIAEGLRLAALGSALGGAGAWAATRALRSMMFEVGAGDPWTLATVTGVLTIVTILAADGPARRAGRVDPMAAMRGD